MQRSVELEKAAYELRLEVLCTVEARRTAAECESRNFKECDIRVRNLYCRGFLVMQNQRFFRPIRFQKRN